MNKLELLESLLHYIKNRRTQFIKVEDLLVYLYRRDRSVRFESVLRALRRLARRGVIERCHRPDCDYYIVPSRLRAYMIAAKNHATLDSYSTTVPNSKVRKQVEKSPDTGGLSPGIGEKYIQKPTTTV